jgi:hypothetical protein
MPTFRSRRFLPVIIGLVMVLAGTATAVGSSPGTDARLSNDAPSTTGYISNYTMVTGQGTPDAAIAECSRSRGRQNEPAVAMDPRNTSVIVGSANDYCPTYDDGNDADGAPIPSGPIWLGYYRSENGGGSFTSSLVPGYPGDTTPYASRAQIRTASSGDPVLAWDANGRLFAGSESSDDPAGTKKTFGDEWVATYENPAGTGGATINDGKEFKRSVVVAHGSSAPNLLGVFHDKTSIEVDRTNGACAGTVYFAWSRFQGAGGGSNIYLVRSTDHGVTFSNPMLLTQNVNDVQDPDIAVTSNGHVYVTLGASVKHGGSAVESVLYAKSTDCGSTFAPVRPLAEYVGYNAADVAVTGGTARDCGDLSAACESGYTFMRLTSSPRSTADQNTATSDESVYVAFHASIPGTETPTGTTFGALGLDPSGTGSQAGAYFVRLDGATGAVTSPKLIDASDHTANQGHQVWPDLSADGGVLHVLWWDSRNDECYSPIRPIGACADRSAVPGLDVYATTSTDQGATFAGATHVSDVTTAPNYDQFSGRTVPFGGDYLWITSVGRASFGAWTDWRNTVAGSDPREGNTANDGPFGPEVHQCRTLNSSGSYTGDTCPRAGGLDQDIYGDLTP